MNARVLDFHTFPSPAPCLFFPTAATKKLTNHRGVFLERLDRRLFKGVAFFTLAANDGLFAPLSSLCAEAMRAEPALEKILTGAGDWRKKIVKA